MSRRQILSRGLAVVTVLTFAGLLYVWRWRSCYSDARLTVKNEIITEFEEDDPANPDRYGTPNNVQVARWIDQLGQRYPEKSDSWFGDEQARHEARYRIWNAPPEPRIFESNERQRFCSHTLDLRYPRKSLHGECHSEDRRLQVLCILSDLPAIRRLTFKDLEEQQQGSMEFYEIGSWETLAEFEGIHYRLAVSVDDFSRQGSEAMETGTHELMLNLHTYRFRDEETFLKTSLHTLDLLEARVRELLSSEAPSLKGFHAKPSVDLIACQCDFTYPAANRVMKQAERASILEDALTELDRRRELLKKHHAVWFEMVSKVLID